jgi:hypothetical protein
VTITDDELKAMAAKYARMSDYDMARIDNSVTGNRFYEDVRRMADALRQSSPPDGQTAGDGWQDISTAPKDGTELILLFDGGVWSGRWVQDEGWFETNNHPTDSWGFGELRPTMWRHYPGPPTKAPGEEH